MSKAHLKIINVRNRLDYDLKNVSVKYAAGNKIQAQGGLATEYWFDWKTVNIHTEENIKFTNLIAIGDVNSKSEKSANDLECSTYYRGYWQVYFTMNGVAYQLNKNNAQANVWDVDDGGELEITILKEGTDIRVDFKLASGNAYFYGEPIIK
ncbi:unnamed protein product [Rotaria socialis]|uniref:Uncharacterized protein n=1 Tax=Rotaria socialis TaxID=392032 RepID=A0A820ZEP0_9BILA|nr:unnamed protein product [Rotaria socialis]CAF3360490.1 unnamed protein product [Rotaria socialis]CAF3460777.1 unnamed protein product [Rotaria socialis]CAF3562485.1 unnamed protein product [Rotaria socialis]CAF3777188.1 unnamed protein product [Rotaria socialis]